MIELKNLSFTAGDTGMQLLYNISLCIKRGERVALSGTSGAGKTTLGYHLCGLHRCALVGETDGRLMLDGRDCTTSDFPGFAGIVMQNPENQLFCENAREELLEVLALRGITGEAARDAARQALDEFALLPYAEKPLQELSLGMKQRVSVAAILALSPPVILLDEPTNFLDPATSDMLFAQLDRLSKTEKTTIIIIEHDLARLARWATRFIRLHEGRLISESQYPPDTKPLKFPSARKTADTPAETALQIKDANFAYKHASPVLQKINLTLYRGEIAALIGDNGSGKTTLLKLAAGLLKPGSGTIIPPPAGRRLRGGLVFQDPDHQLFAATVRAECAFLLEQRKCPPAQINSGVPRALTRMGLAGMERRLPLSLSYGEKRRLSLASLLVGRHKLLCLDEPTVALDNGNLEILAQGLRELSDEGTAVLFATHDLRFAEMFAARIFQIKDGACREITAGGVLK